MKKPTLIFVTLLLLISSETAKAQTPKVEASSSIISSSEESIVEAIDFLLELRDTPACQRPKGEMMLPYGNEFRKTSVVAWISDTTALVFFKNTNGLRISEYMEYDLKDVSVKMKNQ